MRYTSLGSRARLRLILALTVCVWLGLAPIGAAGSLLSGDEEACCCGLGGACLLSGCGCGDRRSAETGDCGGFRSAELPNGAAAVALGHLPGLADGEVPVTTLISIERIVGHREIVPLTPLLSPDPPPPRCR